MLEYNNAAKEWRGARCSGGRRREDVRCAATRCGGRPGERCCWWQQSSKAEGRDVGALETADLRALDSSSQQQQRAIDGVKGDAAEQGSRPPRAKKERVPGRREVS